MTHRVREPEERSGPAPALLLLHGIGSNEDDLMGLAPYLDRRFFIVSARAPIAMWPGGYAWFNIEFTDRGMIANLDQAARSRERIVKFIDEVTQSYGVDPRRLYLMGFSQGAMMSFSVGLRWPDKVAGIVAMSGRLPEQVLAEISQPETLRGMPVFVAHGVYDPVIPVQYGRECRAALEKLPVTLTYREYAMAHEVSPESLSDIAAWLQAVLDRSAPHW